jgi:hypothetical protein
MLQPRMVPTRFSPQPRSAVKLRGGDRKQQGSHDREAAGKTSRQLTCRNRAHLLGTRVPCIEFSVCPTVERHSRRSRKDHAKTEGQPEAANIAAVRAKGSAKTECSHLIISRVVPILLHSRMCYLFTNVRECGASTSPPASRGQMIDRSAPPSGRFDAVTLPPCARTTASTNASPRP